MDSLGNSSKLDRCAIPQPDAQPIHDRNEYADSACGAIEKLLYKKMVLKPVSGISVGLDATSSNVDRDRSFSNQSGVAMTRL